MTISYLLDFDNRQVHLEEQMILDNNLQNDPFAFRIHYNMSLFVIYNWMPNKKMATYLGVMQIPSNCAILSSRIDFIYRCILKIASDIKLYKSDHIFQRFCRAFIAIQLR